QNSGSDSVNSNGITVSFQASGGNSVNSNGATISFQNSGGNAVASNGTTVSFQNSADARSNTGVTVAFSRPPNPASQFGHANNSGQSADPVNTATGNYTFEHTDL